VRRLAGLGILFLLLAAPTVTILGRKPQWARGHLGDPTPRGAYVSPTEKWVCVYGEIRIGLSSKNLPTIRRRLLLENISGGNLEPGVMIAYEEGLETLEQVSMRIQKKHFWEKIHVRDRMSDLGVEGGIRLVYGVTDEIPAHHRVIVEWETSPKHDFPGWAAVPLNGAYPTALLLVGPEEGTPSSSLEIRLHRGSVLFIADDTQWRPEQTWLFRRVPARRHLPEDEVLQPVRSEVFPWISASPASLDTSWPAFSARYLELWKETEEGGSEEAKAELAARLVESAETAYDKALAIGRFVQREIRYCDLNESGLEAWMPLTSEETLRSRKADCKGKVRFMADLLATQGIPARPVVIRIPDRHYSGKIEPVHWLFNHVICAVDLGEAGGELPGCLLSGPGAGWVLFDPTQETSPFGDPPAGYEGVHAMWVDAEEGTLFEIRTREPAVSRVKISMTLEMLDDTILACSAVVEDNGQCALSRRLQRSGVTRRHIDLLTEALAERYPAGSVSHVQLENLDGGGTLPRAVRVSFHVLGASKTIGKRRILGNPLAIVAAFSGLPTAVPPGSGREGSDAPELHPPWNTLANSRAESILIEAEVALDPGGTSFGFPESGFHRSAPWLETDIRWRREPAGTYRCGLRIEGTRGRWDRSRRAEHLRDYEDTLEALHAPILLAAGR